MFPLLILKVRELYEVTWHMHTCVAQKCTLFKFESDYAVSTCIYMQKVHTCIFHAGPTSHSLLRVEVVVPDYIEHCVSLAVAGYSIGWPQRYIVRVHVDQEAHARRARPVLVEHHLLEPAAGGWEVWVDRDVPVSFENHPLRES